MSYEATPFAGLRVVEDPSMVDPVEDWSGVRSPSRAMRRQRAGHRQNIVIRHVPKTCGYIVGGHTLVIHPVAATELRRLSLSSAKEPSQ